RFFAPREFHCHPAAFFRAYLFNFRPELYINGISCFKGFIFLQHLLFAKRLISKYLITERSIVYFYFCSLFKLSFYLAFSSCICACNSNSISFSAAVSKCIGIYCNCIFFGFYNSISAFYFGFIFFTSCQNNKGSRNDK